MNRVFHPTATTILFRMSNSAEHYRNKPGQFRVRFAPNHERTFCTLLEAFLFYIAVDDAAELWGHQQSPVLIERKIKLNLN